MTAFACVRCLRPLRADVDALVCEACGFRAPVVSALPVLTLRPDALLTGVDQAIEAAIRRTTAAQQRIVGAGHFGVRPGLARRIERWERGSAHNLTVLREHLAGLRSYAATRRSGVSGLLDWVAARNVGWWPGQMWPYFVQDWSGSPEFSRVAAIVDRALTQHAPDDRRAVVVGAGACGLAWSAASRFERVAGLDLSVPGEEEPAAWPGRRRRGSSASPVWTCPCRRSSSPGTCWTAARWPSTSAAPSGSA